MMSPGATFSSLVIPLMERPTESPGSALSRCFLCCSMEKIFLSLRPEGTMPITSPGTGRAAAGVAEGSGRRNFLDVGAPTVRREEAGGGGPQLGAIGHLHTEHVLVVVAVALVEHLQLDGTPLLELDVP